MTKNKNELLETFNVKGHLALLNSFLRMESKNDLFVENYEIDGKKYSIYKSDKGLIVECSDGRLLNICINSIDRIDNKSYSPVSAINFDYYFDDNKLEFISLLHSRITPGNNREISLEELVNSSMFSIEHKGEPKGLIVKKYENNQVLEGVVSSIEVFDDDPKLIFFGNGTIMYNGVRFTEDGETIIEFRGNNLPSREKVFNYDVEKEKSKLLQILDIVGDGLHPVTRTIAKKSINSLGTKARFIEEAKTIYGEYTSEVKNAIVNCNRFSEGMTHQLYTNDELMAVIDALTRQNNVEKNAILKKKRNNQ